MQPRDDQILFRSIFCSIYKTRSRRIIKKHKKIWKIDKKDRWGLWDKRKTRKANYPNNDETKVCDFNDFNMLEARLVFSAKEIYIKVLDKDFGDKIMWKTKAYKHEDFQKTKI